MRGMMPSGNGGVGWCVSVIRVCSLKGEHCVVKIHGLAADITPPASHPRHHTVVVDANGGVTIPTENPRAEAMPGMVRAGTR
jgi:hypothetical protein